MAIEFLAHHARLASELGFLVVGLLLLVAACGVAISRLESVSLEDGLYFAGTTAFTIGFGDITPATRSGRIVAILLAMVGLVFIGVFVAVAAEALDRTLVGR